MAVKITPQGNVRVVKPDEIFFWDSDITKHITKSHLQHKMGPTLVYYSEDRSAGELNHVASVFLDSTVFGDVMIVAVSEMAEAGTLKEEDFLDPRAVDAGVILSIYQLVNSRRKLKSLPKNEFLVKSADEIDEQIVTFYQDSYEYVTSGTYHLDGKLYETSSNVFYAADRHEMKRIAEQMLQMFIEAEEYEKCAKIRDVIDKIG